MKYILKISIILMITLMTSSCFDNLYNLQIDGVLIPDEKNGSCLFSYDGSDGAVFKVDDYTMMDITYTKLAGAEAHKYGYFIELGVANKLDADMESKSGVSKNVNTIQTKSIIVKTYSPNNNLVNTQVITKVVNVAPGAGAPIPLTLFSNPADWENLDYSSRPKYFYYGDDSLMEYVTVDIVINAETLAGEYASSNHFKFKINLCDKCLLCPGNSCTTDRDDLELDSLMNACKKRGVRDPVALYSSCGVLYQDKPLICGAEQ